MDWKAVLCLCLAVGLCYAEKPGQCPGWQGGATICAVLCSSDDECEGTQKCCSQGCGIFCEMPVDVDECEDSTHKCAEICHNTPESYRCACSDGMKLEANGFSCTDVDECEDSTHRCTEICQNTIGSYRCACSDGMKLEANGFSCTDVDECEDSTHRCTEICQNTIGSYRCACSDGMKLDANEFSCTDVDECMSNETCQQRCQNSEGAYSCGCDNGYILADDQRRCKGCDNVYNQIVDANQAFESSCETAELLYSTSRDDCLQEACRRGVEVVVARNEVCGLKRCKNSDAQLIASAGSLGWDIFVLNLTWSESLDDDQLGADQGHSDFPVWQVSVAVTLPVLAAIALAVGIAVYLKRRKKVLQAKEPAVPPASPGDVTKPAGKAVYEDVGRGPPLVTANTLRSPMPPPPRSHAEVSAPKEYLDLDLYGRRPDASYDHEPADGTVYDDVRAPNPRTKRAVQTRMSPHRSDSEDPNPGIYEDLGTHEHEVQGPYESIK